MRILQFLSGFDYIDSRYDSKRIVITFEVKKDKENGQMNGRRGIWLYSDEILPLINKIRNKYNVKNLNFDDILPFVYEKITYGEFLKL